MTDKQKNYMRAKMAKVLFRYQDKVCHSCGSEQTCKDLGNGECGIFDSMAKDLINAGYGNVKQAVCQAKNAMCYVGIAADETERLIKERKSYKLFPLADWGMTESNCLTFCRESGVNWQEKGIDLYDILDRVSCWCCANKNQWELYNIWRCLPTYWERLKELQSKTERPFKKEYSVFDLETRFENGFMPKRRKKAV